jgi:hydroxymethylpyrimidine/phosphomethylpyrimidine kinase
MNPPVVLTFAAADPTGGGGLQGDVLTLAALGAHPLSVMTGFFVRDTSRIEGISATEGDWVADQARALLEDIPVNAFKIGQLGSPENVAEIADVLADYPDIPVVFDARLHADNNGIGENSEAADEMLGAICELLLPLTNVVVISATDAANLVQHDDEFDEDTEAEISSAECARCILEMGAQHVLITGTHEQTPQVLNTLYGANGVLRTDAWERLPGTWHGAGDTLSAALTALLAQGMDLSQAARAAQEYTWHCLAQGWRLGMGHSIPNRFCTQDPES